MKNIELAKQSLQALYTLGVRDVVVCPGARCAPLLAVLEATKDFKIYSHFDERAAGFFALGLIQSQNRPAVVVTTSGTAVSELLSPVIEAHYNQLPLIILSADRPKSYRGSGAPQTIEQSKMFDGFVECSFDLENLHDGNFDNIFKTSGTQPLHINVCFDEPLIPGDVAPWTCSSTKVFEGKNKAECNVLNQSPMDFKKPFILVSGSFGFPKELVLDFLKSAQLPVFLEATSGLKNHKELQHLEILFPDLALKQGFVDSVIRVGHIPTHRVWRDLESQKYPVLNFSHKSFSGLSWSKDVFEIHEKNLGQLLELRHPDLASLQAEDQKKKSQVLETLKKFPQSEPALIHQLKSYWPEDQMVYLGNSLPIREWDYVSLDRRCFQNVFANRGANGIDGQISSFLGLSHKNSPSLGVFGDLTTLYDLNSPWILKDLEATPFIAIVNNSGGKIFDRMFKSPLFQNRHERQFQHWAKMWDLDYTKFKCENSPFMASGGVIEITPDEKETKLFWEALS